MARGLLKTTVVAGVALLVGLVLAACGQHGSTASSSAATVTPSTPTSAVPTTLTTTTPSTITTPPPTTTTTVASPAVAGPGSCHASGSGLYVLPNATCTPGATNPQVTQANIGSTICTSGWTQTVRPPESYTEPLKKQQMAAYGDTGPISSYEEDHLIPLELAGSPTSPPNLWPEPGASPNPKDAVENAANKAVCDGTMSLASAQQAIASNWIAFGQQLGVVGSSSPSSPSSTTSTAPPAAAPAPAPSAAPTSSPAPAVSIYKAGEFCPKADVGQTVQSSDGPIICEVTSSPDHPHWEHSS